MWTESSWAFPESYTADESWIVRSSDGWQRADKRAYSSTVNVSFCAIIVRLCHCMIAIMGCSQNLCSPLLRAVNFFIYLYYIALYCIILYYAAQFFPYQECNNAHIFGGTVGFGSKRQWRTAILAVWSESLWTLRKSCTGTNVEESDRVTASDWRKIALVSPAPRSASVYYVCVTAW